MSVFKTQGIVLKVKKINEKESLYTVFFLDYGILLATKKKKVREKSLDTGYGINCEVITREGQNIHSIGNIQITHQFPYEKQSFHIIELYLKMIKTLLSEIPIGTPHREIYKILEFINKQDISTDYQKLILCYLKIQSILGNIPPEDTDITVQKILKFIESHKIEAIVKLKGIKDDIEKKLEQLL